MTVLVNVSDKEHWPNKEAFTLLRAHKDYGLNITSAMPSTFFPLQSHLHSIKSTPTSASGVAALE